MASDFYLWYIRPDVRSFTSVGLSNTAGTLAAIVGTVGAGYFVELVGSFQGFLILTAILYFMSTLFWNIFSTGELVDFDETNQVKQH